MSLVLGVLFFAWEMYMSSCLQSKVPLPPSFTAVPAPKKMQPLSHSEDEDEESDDGSDDETDDIDEKLRSACSA